VSSDKTVDEFNEYYGKMPWLSIPQVDGSAEIKSKLATTLNVCGIPTIVILDAKTGEIISAGEARDDVVAAGGDTEKVKDVIAKWTTGERYPLSEAPRLMDMGSAKQSLFSKVLSILAKNPMIIFGLIYFYRWAQKKMAEMGSDGTASAIEDDTPPSQDGSEF